MRRPPSTTLSDVPRRASLRPYGVAVLAVVVVAVGLGLLAPGDAGGGADAPEWPTAEPGGSGDVWVDPAIAGRPWPDTVEGITTFRGNPTRSWYGTGPLPADPVVDWRYPDEAMCARSDVEGEDRERIWCGSGWTGQPAVFERDGRTWVVVGTYDRAIHFVDADTGEAILEPHPTGDIIKGSVTVDPDGYPLVYSGSRDDRFHIVAFDGDAPRELWTFDADEVEPVLWNDDWDSNALVIDDHLFEGGENGWFFIWRLHRGYDDAGRVTVDPELVFSTPTWDDELLAATGDEQVSVESSVAISGDVAYVANSAGLVLGWDISGLRDGREPEQVLRFWTGDDTDATIVIDDEGFLYVASEVDRDTERGRELGQIMKLDPTRPDDPVVWSIADPWGRGVWATPALHRDLLVVPTDGGQVLGIDRDTGEIRWDLFLRGPTWQSPVVVDDVLVQGDCRGGVLRGFDVSDTSVAPPQVWAVELGGCIESTPAVWEGRVYLATRAGFLHAIGGRAPAADVPLVSAPGGE